MASKAQRTAINAITHGHRDAPRTAQAAARTSPAIRQATYMTAQTVASTQNRFLASYEPPTAIPGDALTPTRWPFPPAVRPIHRSRPHDRGPGPFSTRNCVGYSSRADPPLQHRFSPLGRSTNGRERQREAKTGRRRPLHGAAPAEGPSVEAEAASGEAKEAGEEEL
jgi:hypothetical protein